MAPKKNRLDVVTVSTPGRAGGPANPSQNLPARPRLGDPDDPWSAVLKDIVREAPKTTVVVAGAIVLTLLSLVASLVAVFAGYGAAAPPLDLPIQHALMVAIEAFCRTVSNGG